MQCKGEMNPMHGSLLRSLERGEVGGTGGRSQGGREEVQRRQAHSHGGDPGIYKLGADVADVLVRSLRRLPNA